MTDQTLRDRQFKSTETRKDSGVAQDKDTVYCDRCSGVMFRMRAVYWCTNCGYKTDCCGS